MMSKKSLIAAHFWRGAFLFRAGFPRTQGAPSLGLFFQVVFEKVLKKMQHILPQQSLPSFCNPLAKPMRSKRDICNCFLAHNPLPLHSNPFVESPIQFLAPYTSSFVRQSPPTNTRTPGPRARLLSPALRPEYGVPLIPLSPPTFFNFYKLNFAANIEKFTHLVVSRVRMVGFGCLLEKIRVRDRRRETSDTVGSR